MNQRELTDTPQRSIGNLLLATALACIGFISAALLDKAYLGRGVLDEDWPDLSTVGLLRSALLGIALLLIVGLMCRGGLPSLSNGRAIRPAFARQCIICALILHGVVLGMFLIHPPLFSALSLEDGLFEYGSAALLFLGCGILITALWRSRSSPGLNRAIRPTLLILAAGYFVLGMEEVSWFQRVFDIPTPKSFQGRNSQNELNFHNFNTMVMGNAYFFGAFVFLVAASFAWLLYPAIARNRYLGLLAPRPFVAAIGAIAGAYNFDMWDTLFTQSAFFGGLWILLVFAIAAKQPKDRLVYGLALVVVAATQVLYLTNGSNYDRRWELTEYKEFFIPLALLAYSIDLLIRISHRPLAEPAKS